MVRHYQRVKGGGRANYASSQPMVDAYNSVMNKQLSATHSAKIYKVNKKSLLRRIRGEIAVDAHVGRSTALSIVDEQEIVECLKLASEWGWGFTKSELQYIVQEYCMKTGKETPFRNDRPGRDWMAGFLSRHTSIVARKTEQLSSARARAQDPQTIQQWFELLDSELTKAGVKNCPEQIFNVDESGFVTDPKVLYLQRKGQNV